MDNDEVAKTWLSVAILFAENLMVGCQDPSNRGELAPRPNVLFLAIEDLNDWRRVKMNAWQATRDIRDQAENEGTFAADEPEVPKAFGIHLPTSTLLNIAEGRHFIT